MKRIIFALLVISLKLVTSANAQMVWYNPENCEFNPIEGQYWQNEERSNFYTRFPDRVEPLVREKVWNLSTNSAGMVINFVSSSSQIVVRYKTTSQEYCMPHFPMTGVSGVDMYANTSKGEALWMAARYSFASDHVVYNYDGIKYRDGETEYTYNLYLPPYNGIEHLEIGVKEGSSFAFVPQRTESPIVAYGTSITQGACASRPAMIWTSQLRRSLGKPLYNFGFSGNAYLESEIIDLIADIPACVYILDCMPNLHTTPTEQLTELIVKQVKRLRERRPNTPILLADHLGYPHGEVIDIYAQYEKNAVTAQTNAFKQLKKEGMKHIYHLSNKDINMPSDATVEAIHPSDWGMKVYADAYTKILKKILR